MARFEYVGPSYTDQCTMLLPWQGSIYLLFLFTKIVILITFC